MELVVRDVLLQDVIEVVEPHEVLLDVLGEAVDALLERGHLRHRLDLRLLELLLGGDLIDDLGQVRLVGLAVEEVQLLTDGVVQRDEVLIVAGDLPVDAAEALADFTNCSDHEGAQLVRYISWRRCG